MNIIWRGFAAKNHSWAIVAQNICRELIKQGHHVDIFSTNGTLHFPEDLKPYLKVVLEEDAILSAEEFHAKTSALLPEYDMQLSYTALKNFNKYFSRGSKNRFGIWNYETTVLPKAFAKGYLSVDKVLPSSQFSKQVFIDGGIPESHQEVVHHGIHLENYNCEPYPLKTKKRYKILSNIAQPHLRKNIPGLLEAYGKAFTKQDDVCLVLKISKRSPQTKIQATDVDFNNLFNKFKQKYKQHAEVEIIDHFLPNIEPLYLACDVVMSMTHAECFWMPGLEGFGAKKIVMAPRYGGQLDFMNDDNSMLIEGKTIRADTRMQYWEPSLYAKVFDPSVDDAVDKLRAVINNYDYYQAKFVPNIESILPQYTWSSVVQHILSLTK